MRKHVSCGSADQGRWRFGIDAAGQIIGARRTLGQRLQDFGLAPFAVSHKPGETPCGVFNGGAVPGMKHPPSARLQLFAGCHKVCQVPVRGAYKRAGPTHHMVTRQTDIPPCKRNMVAKVARRMQHLERPAIARNDICVGDRVIRVKMHVDAFSATGKALTGKIVHDRTSARKGIAKGPDFCTGGFRQLCSKRRVIQMGMSHDDMADVLVIGHGRQNGLEMGIIVGAGIDHGQSGCAQNIGVGAAKRHRRGVRRQDAAQPRLHFFRDTGNGIKGKNFRVHGLSFWSVSLHGLAMTFRWLKHYMPRSLYGRAALILILPVITLQLVVSVAFIQRHFEGVTRQMSNAAAREINLIVETVNLADDTTERASDLVFLSDVLRAGISYQDETAIEDRRRWYDFSGIVIDRIFTTRIPGYRGIDLPDNDFVNVFVDSDLGLLKVQFDRRRVSASNPHQLLVSMVFFGGLMTLIAYFYLRNQLRPITRLSTAAEAFGKGRNIPYSPNGAIEVRAAGNAFLDMRSRIERQIEQRTMMLSGVSHDLRTPLTRLKLGLSLIEEEEAELLLQDVDEMERLLDVFLSFARDAKEGDPEEVDPFALVERIVQDSARSGHDVTLVSCEGSGVASFRVVGVRRAIENIIGNAVRYGSKAEVSVVMTDKYLRIRVEDDGPGIPEDAREEAQKPFTRLDPARNQNKGTGVGLGLAIAADVARAHGGVLRLGASETLGGLRADIVIGR